MWPLKRVQMFHCWSILKCWSDIEPKIKRDKPITEKSIQTLSADRTLVQPQPASWTEALDLREDFTSVLPKYNERNRKARNKTSDWERRDWYVESVQSVRPCSGLFTSSESIMIVLESSGWFYSSIFFSSSLDWKGRRQEGADVKILHAWVFSLFRSGQFFKFGQHCPEQSTWNSSFMEFKPIRKYVPGLVILETIY